MPIALVVKAITETRRTRRVTFTPTMSGSYVTGGDTLNFATATDPNALGYAAPGGPPENIVVQGSLGGRQVTPIIGTTNANSLLKMFDSKDTQAAAAAYDAGVLADDDNCRIIAEFAKNN